MQNNGLKTKDVLARRNITYPYCFECDTTKESMIHVFRNCPLIRHIWLALVDHNYRGQFFIINEQYWI